MVGVDNGSWTKWRQLGQDAHSIRSDPLFDCSDPGGDRGWAATLREHPHGGGTPSLAIVCLLHPRFLLRGVL